MANHGDQEPQVVVQAPPIEPVKISNIVPKPKHFVALHIADCVARGVAALCTLIVTAMMGSANQTVDVSISRHYTVESSIEFSKYSSLQYFVASNAIVMFLSIGSLILSIIFKSKNQVLKLAISVVDLVALSLLLTGNGAACAAITYFDNIDNIFTYSTCDTYDEFCSKVKASIIFSFFAVFVYLLLVGLSLLYKRKK